MQYINVAVTLLTSISLCSSLQIGQAIVVNRCRVPVYYKSVGTSSSSMSSILPNGEYREDYQYLPSSTADERYTGVSIKLSPNQSISSNDNFDGSTITQFEYTFIPEKPPGLWYDISNVNGYGSGAADSWNGIFPWPFQDSGLILEVTSNNCASVICPGGNPNGNSTCAEAYTHSYDNFATHGCMSNNSLILTLCSITSSLLDISGTGTTQIQASSTKKVVHGCSFR